jgi:hypothetical protein
MEHILNQHDVDICLLSETFLIPGQFQACQLCLPPHRQMTMGGRHSHLSTSLYSPTPSARSRPNPLGGYCYSSHIGGQTGENTCGLIFGFPPTDRRDLNDSLGEGLPVLTVGDLNAKRVN